MLGVSHYRESWLYGPDAVEPSAVTQLWVAPWTARLLSVSSCDIGISRGEWTGHASVPSVILLEVPQPSRLGERSLIQPR